MDTDRNLLFGVLALQADLLVPQQFAEACTAWSARKDTPLADLLVERGWLTAEAKAHLDFLLACKLEKHGGDAQASLAAVAGPGVRRVLETVDDPDVEQSLTRLPPVDVHASDLPTVDAWPMAGRYRVLRPLARGGLGEVFVAEDTELHRPVALKEIQLRHAAQSANRQRFLLEAEITGGLEHPGIVPVYGLSAYPDGRPFYAMRLIHGDSLKEALLRFHQAPDFRGPAFRQLLRRFVDVCNAVAYAHSRGVLHRDLKPANIMLGPFGETLVVDWGLAKVVGRERTGSVGTAALEEPTLQPASASGQAGTVAGTALGTPAYMSPEQAAGRLDELGPASDVYSLGATFYAVLTGHPPLEGTDAGELLRRAQGGDWVPPGQLNPAVPSALDAICRQAMARDPVARYPTPLALAADVERWLADEPVGAYRDPVTVRLVRWGRRHQKLVASGTALLLTALLALALGLVAVEQERKQTAAANERERAARSQAEANFRLARDAVDHYLNAVTEDPRLKEKDFFELRRKLLATAVPFYERFARVKAGDPEQEVARGQAYGRLSSVRQQMGEREAGLADGDQMQAVFAQLAADCPTVPHYRQELARSHNNRGHLLMELGRRSEAETECRRALALREQLAADFPTVTDYRQELAQSYHNLGFLLAELGKQAEAEAAYRQALLRKEQLAAGFPQVPEYRQDLAMSHTSLGNLLAAQGKRTEAEGAYRQALALCERLMADFPRVPIYRQELAYCHNNLGLVLAELWQRSEAETECRRALVLKEQLAADFPSIPAYRQDVAGSYYNLGNLLKSLGKRSEAEATYRQALSVSEKLAAEFPTVPGYSVDLGGGYCNFGHLVRERGEVAASVDWYGKAVATLRPVLAREPRLVTAGRFLRNAHEGRAAALVQLGRHAEAAADWEQAAAHNDEKTRDVWFRMQRALALTHAAKAVTATKRLQQAVALAQAGRYTEATAAVEQVLQPENADSNMLYAAACVYALAAARTDKQTSGTARSPEAEKSAARAVDLLRQAVQKGYKDVAHLKEGRDLESLRQRPDFQRMLAELEAKAPVP